MSTILHHFHFAVHFFSIHPKENNKAVNDSTVNEYSRETFNLSSKSDFDKMNILFGHSAFMKDLSEEQKGRVDDEDEELDL